MTAPLHGLAVGELSFGFRHFSLLICSRWGIRRRVFIVALVATVIGRRGAVIQNLALSAARRESEFFELQQQQIRRCPLLGILFRPASTHHDSDSSDSRWLISHHLFPADPRLQDSLLPVFLFSPHLFLSVIRAIAVLSITGLCISRTISPDSVVDDFISAESSSAFVSEESFAELSPEGEAISSPASFFSAFAGPAASLFLRDGLLPMRILRSLTSLFAHRVSRRRASVHKLSGFARPYLRQRSAWIHCCLHHLPGHRPLVSVPISFLLDRRFARLSLRLPVVRRQIGILLRTLFRRFVGCVLR